MIFSPLQKDTGMEVLRAMMAFFTSNDLEGCAMAYSGGLDSSVLLALGPKSVVPYTLGEQGSRDFSNSLDGAARLGFSPVFVPISSVDLVRYIELVRSIDHSIKKKDLGYEVVLAILLDHISEVKVITGQGADEIFYGYSIFSENPNMDNSLHMKKLYQETLPREQAIAEHYGKKLITPYLSSGIVEIMENIGREENFAGGFNKAILRSAGMEAGMPQDIVERRKTAAQYGSGLMKKLKSLPIWSNLPQ